MNTIDVQTQSELARAGSYREFLKIYFEKLQISYAEVGRRGGFSSRSYPRDVTEGRRRLTSKSLASLARGLRLKPELAKVFQLLYFTENVEEHPDALSGSDLQLKLEQSRARALKTAAKEVLSSKPTRGKLKMLTLSNHEEGETFAIADGLTDVLASLGSSGEGMTLDAIHRKTGFSRPQLASKLELLMNKNVIRYDANERRYFSTVEHLDWTGESGNRLSKAIYQSSVERLTQATKTSFKNPEALFLNTAVSIPKSQLPQLRAELKELIMKFADTIVEGEANIAGKDDTVVQIVTGLFEGRLATSL